MPPGDGNLSDGDSGAEDDNSIDHLSKRQFEAPAEVFINNDIVELGIDYKVSNSSNILSHGREPTSFQRSDILPNVSSQSTASDGSKRQKKKEGKKIKHKSKKQTQKVKRVTKKVQKEKAKEKRMKAWKAGTYVIEKNEWNQPPLLSVLSIGKGSPAIEYFKLFFDDKIVNHIVKESVKYAVHMNNCDFTLWPEDIYNFLGILILSGYVPLPRRRMYWEKNPDT